MVSKLVKVLEKIKDEYHSWKEIQDYCKEIGIDNQYVWNVIMEDRNELVDHQSFPDPNDASTRITKYRLNTRGIEFLQKQIEKESWKPTKRELVYAALGFFSALIIMILSKVI